MVVLGCAMWISSLLGGNDLITVWAALGLTIVNSLLLAYCFYKGGATNIPSVFVLSTYWLAISAIPMLHQWWQLHLIVFAASLMILVLLNIQYQKEATEEAFLTTMICCFLAPLQEAIIVAVIILWGYLIIKGYMTWRVWMASLIAIALRIFVMVGLRYTGWLQWMWIENLPCLAWQEWLIGIGIVVTTFVAILLPMRKASVGTGLFYLVYLIALLTAGTVLTYGGFF